MLILFSSDPLRTDLVGEYSTLNISVSLKYYFDNLIDIILVGRPFLACDGSS